MVLLFVLAYLVIGYQLFRIFTWKKYNGKMYKGTTFKEVGVEYIDRNFSIFFFSFFLWPLCLIFLIANVIMNLLISFLSFIKNFINNKYKKYLLK